MNLNQLRAFTAVAREGNLTRAAQALRLSQPAVSKQLAELEADLGSALFDRLPRGVRLTSAGSLLLGHAERILATEAQAHKELRELHSLARGRLAIGASTTIGSYLVPPLFGEFQRAHPQVALALEIANTAQIQAAVLDDRVDLGLTEGFVVSDALEVEVVAKDEIVAIAPPGHPLLAERSQIDAARLARVPFLMREPGSGSRDVIEAALRGHDVALVPAMELGSTEALKSAVASGLGIAMVSRLAVELELRAGVLVELPIRDLTIRRSLHLLRLRAKQPSVAMGAFLDLLHARQAQRGAGPGDVYAI
jgi:DNA-binding transcriptional LysR family regulator